jgi:hypothetical protein
MSPRCAHIATAMATIPLVVLNISCSVESS